MKLLKVIVVLVACFSFANANVVIHNWTLSDEFFALKTKIQNSKEELPYVDEKLDAKAFKKIIKQTSKKSLKLTKFWLIMHLNLTM